MRVQRYARECKQSQKWVLWLGLIKLTDFLLYGPRKILKEKRHK